MALVTRVAQASGDTTHLQKVPQISGDLYAGEALDAVAACYIKAADGLVYMSNGTAANEAAKLDGFTARAVAVGQPVTLYGVGARFRYGTGLTVGANYYIAATAGRLDTAPTAGGVAPVARTVNGTDIRVLGNADVGKLTKAGTALFVSAEQTGTGSPQNIAHGLGVAPAAVFTAPTDTAPATTGVYTLTEGAHDATNVVVTVTSGKKFKVMAWA